MEETKALDRIVVRSQANVVLAFLGNKRRKILVKSLSLLRISNFQKPQTKKASKSKTKKEATVEIREAKVLIMKDQVANKSSTKIII